MIYFETKKWCLLFFVLSIMLLRISWPFYIHFRFHAKSRLRLSIKDLSISVTIEKSDDQEKFVKNCQKKCFKLKKKVFTKSLYLIQQTDSYKVSLRLQIDKGQWCLAVLFILIRILWKRKCKRSFFLRADDVNSLRFSKNLRFCQLIILQIQCNWFQVSSVSVQFLLVDINSYSFTKGFRQNIWFLNHSYFKVCINYSTYFKELYSRA